MTTEVNNPIAEKWDGDHLNRVEVAKFLTTYLNRIYLEGNDGPNSAQFVLNLNASWGQGKTFLLNKWAVDLKKAKYPVVEFDAWKNDFSRDPLVGFIAELEAALNDWLGYIAPVKELIGTVIDTSKKIISLSARIFGGPILGQIVENVTGLEGVGGKVSDKTSDYAENALTEHRSVQALIEKLKADMRALIQEIERHIQDDPDCDVQLPLYIFVDELDRCRPTYAIELLENIKHLFGVRGVIFVVATNKEQLCHSIGAVYGTSFDSSAYLGRFFDQEYALPEPDNLRFANHLFEKYKINDSDERLFVSKEKGRDTPNNLAETFALFCDAFDLPLRDQEQTIHRIKAILANYLHDPVYFDYLVFLLMLRKKSEPLFDRFFIEYPKNRAEFEVPLSKIFKGQKKIRVQKVSFHGGIVGASDETLFSLIHLYASMANKDLDIVHKESREFEDGITTKAILYREASSYKAPSLAIREYPKLVRQVGQLS